jgi:hypothetical protein
MLVLAGYSAAIRRLHLSATDFFNFGTEYVLVAKPDGGQFLKMKQQETFSDGY